MIINNAPENERQIVDEIFLKAIQWSGLAETFQKFGQEAETFRKGLLTYQKFKFARRQNS